MGRTSIWWDEDREDATQEAALAIMLASRRGLEKGRDYYFGAARKGVYLWIRNWLRPQRDTFPLLELAERLLASNTTMGDAMLRHLEALAPLLRGQRTRNSPTAEEDIALEVAYVRLQVEGYSMDEIAEKLGRTRRNTHALRERVMPRLQRIADGIKPVPGYVTPKPHQIEALARVNRDPEAVRRRNEAISKAKRANNMAR